MCVDSAYRAIPVRIVYFDRKHAFVFTQFECYTVRIYVVSMRHVCISSVCSPHPTKRGESATDSSYVL